MSFRHVLAASAATAALSASASTYTDLYFDPAQPGWGVSVVQQLDNAFITLFTYDAQGRPTWLVAPDAVITAIGTPGNVPIFSGPLYRTEGSPLGAPYDPARHHGTPVGQVSIEALDRDRVRLHFTADGVSGIREIRRLTFAQPIEIANYTSQAALRQVRAGQPFGTLSVQAETLVHLDSESGLGYVRSDDQLGRRCEYRGPYAVSGKLVRMTGSYTCTSGDQPSGTFDLSEVEFTAHGFTGYLKTSAAGNDGQYGRIAGVRW